MADASLETPPAAAGEAAWKEVALLMVQAAARHAVHLGEVEVASFQRLVRESVAQPEHPESPSRVLIAAGVLSQAMAQYCSQTQRQVDALVADYSATIQAFLGHLEHLHGDPPSQAAVTQLREMLEAALRSGRVGEVREQVAATLTELSQQAEARRREALELTGKLRDRVAILEQALPAGARAASTEPAPAVDPCTGLPVRSEAELALRQAIDAGPGAPQRYAVIFYLHRMALTNARFGEAIGNQVILFCSQHIATVVTRATDLLFRWSGPALLAVIERPESPLAVSSEVQRLVAAPLSRFFETPSRSVYLPIKVSADVAPLFNTNYAEVEERIQRFILHASGQANAD